MGTVHGLQASLEGKYNNQYGNELVCLFTEYIMLNSEMVAQRGLILVLAAAVLATDCEALLVLVPNVPCDCTLVDPLFTVLALHFSRF